ncbi:chromosome partitioning protein [Chromatium okenii]|uniref:ParA family protein n=1 Tax=Chromatium okenii TaxID=61644 RepID=UPI0019047734|nr:ParA family protein [Chromatium okenii]MBK1640748.1 chromosome partitioning protein [Chromatium okenii]
MSSRPRILVITNRKGGTGKTTTAVNFAAEFAASGQRTLLIDLDTQNHCALGLGVKLAANHPTAHHLFSATAPVPLSEAIVNTAWLGLDLVTADPDFHHDRAPDDEHILVRALAEPALAGQYDWIVLDSPPSLDVLLINALTAAHWALIPFMPHPLSGEGVRQLARVFFRVAMNSNADLRLLGLLPVMLDTRIVQHRRVQEQIISQFGQERLLGGIRSDIKLAESFAAGQPIREYAPRSRGNEDYQTAFANLCARLIAAPSASGR